MGSQKIIILMINDQYKYYYLQLELPLVVIRTITQKQICHGHSHWPAIIHHHHCQRPHKKAMGIHP